MTSKVINIVKQALAEDLKPSGDITTKLIKNNKKIKAKIIANENCVIGGLNFAERAFKYSDKKIIFQIKTKEGKKINKGKVVESLGAKKVIFLPDKYLAKYVTKNTDVEIISWKGTCVVHEQFTEKEINEIKEQNPGIIVIAHPECPPDVINAADFAGSTSGMSEYVKKNQPKKVMMVTECSMSDNVQVENPKVEFIKPCNLCPYMKKITLPKILDCLENESNEIIIPGNLIKKAKLSVEKMTLIGR